MSTKIDCINKAYSQMRVSGLTVNPTPEDVSIALDRLESMMAELYETKNIDLGYNFEDEPDPNSDTMVPRSFWQMMETNLAIRLIPDFNKAVPQVLLSQATQSLSSAQAWSAARNIQQVAYPNRQPIGSGNSRFAYWRRFYRQSTPGVDDANANNIYVGDISDYSESYSAFLDTVNGETLSSYTISADPRLTIVSDSQSGDLISYRVEANDSGTGNAGQQVKIVITTSTGRVNTRLIDFNVIVPNPVG